jgi:RluA family pseudouridine synthase
MPTPRKHRKNPAKRTQKRKPFKMPPRKYQPEGLAVLYEDHDILVVDKKSGLLTMSTETIRENTAYFRLTSYVRKGNSKSRNRVFIVHRLDRDTSGVLVFAKNVEVKLALQKAWREFDKQYLAVVHGTLPEKEGVITSYLAENSVHRMFSIDNPEKGLLAKTGYKVLKESRSYSLLEIDLLTGRKNQIRVHLAEEGFPVVGDKKYGKPDKGIKRLALHAASLTLVHPETKEKMVFEAKTPAYFKTLLAQK